MFIYPLVSEIDVNQAIVPMEEDEPEAVQELKLGKLPPDSWLVSEMEATIERVVDDFFNFFRKTWLN